MSIVQIVGIAFRSGYSVDFAARLYSCSAAFPNSKYLVEFQRRFGDHAAFLTFYEETLAQLREVVDLQEVVQKNCSARRLLSPPPLDDEEPAPLTAQEVVPLLGMAGSNYLDCQREGLRGLLVTSSPWSDAVLREVKDELVPAIGNALLNRDWEVRRCGATLLAQISKVESFHDELVPLIAKVIPLLQSSDLKMAETRRQLAAVIVNLAGTRKSFSLLMSFCFHCRPWCLWRSLSALVANVLSCFVRLDVDLIRQYSPLLQYNCNRCSDGRLRNHLLSALNVISVS